MTVVVYASERGEKSLDYECRISKLHYFSYYYSLFIYIKRNSVNSFITINTYQKYDINVYTRVHDLISCYVYYLFQGRAPVLLNYMSGQIERYIIM